MSEVQTEKSEQRRSKLLVGVIGALVVAVCVQGAYMFYIHGQLQKAVASTKSDDDGWTVIPNPAAKKEASAKPDAALPGIGALPDPFSFGFGSANSDPFQEMAKMRQQMEQLFNQSMGGFKDGSHIGNSAQPSASSSNSDFDMTDQGDKYVIKVDMPGTDQSSIHVEIKDQTLTVTGKRDQTISKEKGGRVLRQERISGQFERSMPLPGPVDETKMKTSYENGVFTVILPKLAETKTAERLRL